MNNGMNRREFLKYSLATGALIAAGDGMMENVMAQAAANGGSATRIYSSTIRT